MPRRRDADSDDEFDLPEGVYHDEDDDPPTVPCPYCRAELAEDAVRCPRCENYISREDRPAERRGWFFWVMMAAAVGCAAWWLIAM